MWAAYWSNCVGPATRTLSLMDRCKMLNRCVRPVLHFRNTRWPYTQTLAEEQDRVQRRMLSQFLHLERLPTDDDDTYFRRRMRTVASVARQLGSWGSDHARRVVSWSEHLKRSRNSFSLAARLYTWRDENWLQQRRLDPLIGGTSRPGTRSSSGPVHRRWDEAVESAALALARA